MSPDRPRMRSSPEFDLIGAIRDRLGAAGGRVALGIGDDAAVTVPGGATATSVDALVDGVHFRRRWCPPRSIGHKALGSALSDLAAMGAEPGEAYVWLGVPEDFDRDACLEVADGIAELARASEIAVCGGDLTRSPALAVCVTAVGHAASPEQLLGRGGAASGMALCVTGSIGAAGAGLSLLEYPELAERVAAEHRRAAIARQLEPSPRLAEGRALAAAGAAAMIDLSDGLAADAEQLAAASGVGIELELERVPVAAGVAAVAEASGRDPYEFVVDGGEDYELLAALPRSALLGCMQAVRSAGGELTEIGRCTEDGAVRLRLPGGRSMSGGGYDHLRPAR